MNKRIKKKLQKKFYMSYKEIKKINKDFHNYMVEMRRLEKICNSRDCNYCKECDELEAMFCDRTVHNCCYTKAVE